MESSLVESLATDNVEAGRIGAAGVGVNVSGEGGVVVLVPDTPPSAVKALSAPVNQVNAPGQPQLPASRPRNPLLANPLQRRLLPSASTSNANAANPSPTTASSIPQQHPPPAAGDAFVAATSAGAFGVAASASAFVDQDASVWAKNSHTNPRVHNPLLHATAVSRSSGFSIEQEDHALVSLISIFPKHTVQFLRAHLRNADFDTTCAINAILAETESSYEISSSASRDSPLVPPPKKRKLIKKADVVQFHPKNLMAVDASSVGSSGQHIKTIGSSSSLASFGDDSPSSAALLVVKRPSSVSLITSKVKSQKRKKEHTNKESFSDDDDGGAYDDDDDDSEAEGYRDQDDAERISVMEAQMFEFFGTVVRRELIDTLMCTEEQADCILEFRPFESITDLYEKFGRVKKGKQKVSKLMEKYHSLMDGYSQVDQLINTCERKGDELMSVMNGWISRGALSPVKAAPPVVSDAVSETENLLLEEEDDGGLHITSIPLIDDGVDDAVAVSNPNHCLKTQPQILNPKMKLKSYQLVGVSWLNLLYSKSLGGILADEMGLGKTAQVIAFISLLKEQRQVGTPHLIVVPSSTLENWLREFQNWSPSLNVLSYYGSQSERQEIRYHVAEKDLADYDAVVTTYNLSSSKEDRVFLKKLRPRSLILDEGHMVKNMESSRYKNLNSINAPFRLLLTGTPLQNNLMELLSLLTFIMPRVFAQDEEALKQIFNLKSTTSSDATVLNRQRIQRAKKMMTPFVLRRKKDDVLTELPAKSHQEVMCTMTPTQDALYQSIIADCKKSFFARAHAEGKANNTMSTALPGDEIVDSVGGNTKKSKKVGGTPKKAKLPLLPGSGTENINVLMQLRKAANHPLLFRRLFTDVKIKVMAREIMKEEQYMEANMQYIFEDMQVMSDFELHKLCMNFKSIKKHALNADQWMDSGKVQSLSKLLPAMLEKGDRVLIFSQFVIMLDVLESVMKTLGIRYLRLDGQTNVVDRQSLIDQYNEDDTIGVFLLSTKAGGLGLNLTSANVVIIHDMDFNPHNDAQAEDRAHRVGQTREVTVLKLVVSGSVEQHILRLATTKLKLDKSLQQRGVSLEEDGDDVEGGNSSNGRTSSKSTDFVENEVDATLATVDDDKKLMEMLRSEWRVSGETL